MMTIDDLVRGWVKENSGFWETRRPLTRWERLMAWVVLTIRKGF